MTGEAQQPGGEMLGTPEHDVLRPTMAGIIDLGSQLLKPIDRKLREIGVNTTIYPHDVSPQTLLENCDFVVVSGGGDSTYDEGSVRLDSEVYSPEFPLPGIFICLAMQQMNQVRGGSVERGETSRYGQRTVEITETDTPLFAGFGSSTEVLFNAGDCVTPDNLAPGLKVLALSHEGDHKTVAAFADESGKKIGVQFHPEVDLTERGDDIFRHFIEDIAGLELNYTAETKRTTVRNIILSTLGDKPVATAASGGVDSTVLAVALGEEVGERQYVIHIDTGLMRKGESQLVLNAFEELGLPNVHFVDATSEFRHARTRYNGRTTRMLQYETDPEAKRHIIGDTFARMLDSKFKELGLDPDTAFLAQGTLRPDLIESAGIGKSAKKIKTHHNDTTLIREWRERGTLLEPLSDLHKDEVRELGIELGLHEEVVWRQPFPGPGLGVRIICAYEAADFEERPKVERMLRGEFSDHGTSVHLLPIRTVGVQGDDRTYRHVAAISTDGQPDWPRYMEYASAIPQLYPQINRVIFTFGERIHPRRSLFDSVIGTSLVPRVVEVAQEVDDQVNYAIRKHGLLRRLAQEPVILTPLAIDGKRRGRLSVLRPFVTNDFMVGSAAVPGSENLPLDALAAQVEAAHSVKGISRVAIDLTGKPPGTTEWE